MTIFDAASAKQMLAIGSILHTASDGAVIWGSGLNGTVPEGFHNYDSLDVRAVRGPVTRQYLLAKGIKVPEIYGDPGLLISHLHAGRFPRQSEYNLGIVPHYSDLSFIKDALPDGSFVINPLRSWNEVVSDIVRCDRIISSSLHGVVVAESYGIPATLIRISENESPLKYVDYYAGTGRDLTYCTSIGEALVKKSWIPPIFDVDSLMNSFPYDLWK